MKIRSQDLIQKVEELDGRILGIWLDEEHESRTDEEKWALFVDLLETRVEMLKVLRDAGVPLSDELCLPRWLQNLTDSRFEVRRRELRRFEEERRNRKVTGMYEKVGAWKPEGNPK